MDQPVEDQEMLHVNKVLRIAMGDSADAPQAIEAIAAHRRTIARALLRSAKSPANLTRKTQDVLLLAASVLPWDLTSEDYDLIQAILARWKINAPELNVLLAAMALAPAYNFPSVMPLKSVPLWIRPQYARYLISAPPIFQFVGEADRYAAHCTKAMQMFKTSIIDDELPDAVNLAQSILSVGNSMIYFNEQSLKKFFTDKSAIIEWFLLKTGHKIDFSLQKPPSSSRPKIGILLNSISLGTETFYVLAHLKGLNRSAIDVTLYLMDARSTSLSEAFNAWTDRITQLSTDLKLAVDTIRRDQLDICLIALNATWGASIQTLIAAHHLARIQVIGAASPVTTGLSSADLFLSGTLNDTAHAAQDYEEGLIRLPGAVTYYAFSDDHERATTSCNRASLGFSENEIVFFSSANYYKITPELLTTWCEILARVPDSRLLLMPFNPNWNSTYPVALFLRRLTRQLSHFGIRADRVRTVYKVPTRADLHMIMALADVYLDSFPFSGACSLVDPLVLGLPIVARRGKTFRSSVASSILLMDKLDEAITCDNDAYIARAVYLAEQPDLLRKRKGRIGSRSATPASIITESFAKKFERFCLSATQAIRNRDNEIRISSPADISGKIEKTVSLVLASPPVRFQCMTDLDIATELLMPIVLERAADKRSSRRVIDVGACTGTFSRPFLQAGFRVDMFEPDPDCADVLSELTRQYVPNGYHHAVAVTGKATATVTFHKRSVGLSGLGNSPFGDRTDLLTIPATTLEVFLANSPPIDLLKIDAEGYDFEILRGANPNINRPSAILIEFGEHFESQSLEEISRLLSEMDALSYGAVIFELKKMTDFGKTNWNHKLVDMAFDTKRLGKKGDAFGNIIFYQKNDMTFLIHFLNWLEALLPACQRPIAQALQATYQSIT